MEVMGFYCKPCRPSKSESNVKVKSSVGPAPIRCNPMPVASKTNSINMNSYRFKDSYLLDAHLKLKIRNISKKF